MVPHEGSWDAALTNTAIASDCQTSSAVADPELANGGAKVERRRREYRGAEGAEGVGRGKGVSPYPLGEESGEEAVPLPRKIFWL